MGKLVTCPVCKTDQCVFWDQICNHIGADGFGCPGGRQPVKAPSLSFELVEQTCQGILNQDDWLDNPAFDIAIVYFYSGRTKVCTLQFYNDVLYTLTQEPTIGVRHLQDARTYGRAVQLIEALSKQVPNLQEFVGKQVI